MPIAAPRTSWIVAPPEICVLCLEPLGRAETTSAWNGRPAHRECVRVHLIQRDPAFRDWGGEPASEESGEGPDPAEGTGNREEDDEEPG